MSSSGYSTAQGARTGKKSARRIHVVSPERASSLMLGGETKEEQHALKFRTDAVHNPKFYASVQRLWGLFEKDATGYVTRGCYVDGMLRICRALAPHLSGDEARDLVLNDWAQDAGGSTGSAAGLDFDAFFLSMATLTDLWCPGSDSQDLVSFTDELFCRVSVRVTVSSDGTEVVTKPLTKFLFIASEPAAEPQQDSTSEPAAAAPSIPPPAPGISIPPPGERLTDEDREIHALIKSLNPSGLDLRRPTTRKREFVKKRRAAQQVPGSESKPKAPKISVKSPFLAGHALVSMRNGAQLAREAREARERAIAAVLMEKLNPKGFDLRRPSQRKRAKKAQDSAVPETASGDGKPGTWHFSVFYGPEENTNPEQVTSYRWADVDSIRHLEQESKSIAVGPNQYISPMWTTNLNPHIVSTRVLRIQDRHKSFLRRISKDSVASGVASSDASAATHRMRFRAMARAVGRLSSLKELALERHMLLYGKDMKNRAALFDQHAEAVQKQAIDASQAIPEAAPAASSPFSQPPAGVVQEPALDLDTPSSDPYTEGELDAARAVPDRRRILVFGEPADMASALSEHVGSHLSMPVISRPGVVRQTLDAYTRAVEFAQNPENAETLNPPPAAAEDGAEAPPPAELTDDEKLSRAAAHLGVSDITIAAGKRLLNGEAVSTAELASLMVEHIVGAASGARGFVVSNFPSSVAERDALVAKLGADFAVDHLLELQIDLENLVQRQSGRRCDLLTGVASTEVDRTGKKLSVQQERERITQARWDEARAAAEEEGEGAEPEVDMEALEAELPTIPADAELLGSVPCQLPEDEADAVRQRNLPTISSLLDLSSTNVVAIGAAQPLADVQTLALEQLVEHPAPLGRDSRCLIPVPVPVPDGLMQADEAASSINAAQRNFLLHGTVEGAVEPSPESEPAEGDAEPVFPGWTRPKPPHGSVQYAGKLPATRSRRWSCWETYCPVSSTENPDSLHPGSAAHAVVYGGKVYCMESEACKAKFLSNPKAYVNLQPRFPAKRTVAVIGPELGGGEEAARTLSKKYGLRLTSARDVVTAAFEDANASAAQTPEGEAPTLKSSLASPEGVTDDLIVPAILANIGEVAAGGWITAGCPVTGAQVEQLIEAGWQPDVAVVYDPVTEDEGRALLEARQSSVTHMGVQIRASLSESQQRYADEHPKIVAALQAAGIEVKAAPATGDVDDVIAWADQHANPFVLREDPEADQNAGQDPLPGLTGQWCPVSLSRGVLTRGRDEFTCRVNGAAYRMSSQKFQAKFKANPAAYVPRQNSADEAVVTRLLLLGPTGSNVPQMAAFLGSQLNMNVVDLSEDATVKEAAKQVDEEGQAVPVSEDVFFSAYVRATMSPDRSRAIPCIIVGDPATFTPELLGRIESEGMAPSGAIAMRIPAELAADRRIDTEFKWSPPQLEQPDEDDADDEEAEKLTAAQIDEMRAEARTGFRDTLIEQTVQSSELCSAAADACASLGIQIYGTVSLNAGSRLAEKRVLTAARNGIEKHRSCCGGAYAVETSEADVLVGTGFIDLSKFGCWCPVALLQKGAVVRGTHAIVYGNHLYFCSTEARRNTFVSDPVAFTRQRAPGVQVPPSVCVIGAPKSGAATACDALAKRFGLVSLTPSNLLDWARQQSSLVCGRAVAAALSAGDTVGFADLVQALRYRVQLHDCRSRGWILKGFPSSLAEAQAMIAAGVAPRQVFILPGILKTSMARSRSQHQESSGGVVSGTGLPSDKARAPHVAARFQAWINESDSMAAVLTQAYQNVHRIDTHDADGKPLSRWSIMSRIEGLIKSNCDAASAHVTSKRQLQAAPIFGMALNSKDLRARRGHFGSYCPVSYCEEGRLVDTACNSVSERTFGAEYRGRIYFCADAACLKKFLAAPSHYLSGGEHAAWSEAPTLPKHLPLLVPLGAHLRLANEIGLSFGGYCPVTYSEGRGPRDWSSIVEADPLSVAMYQGKYYGFASGTKKRQFMEQPGKYVGLQLPCKLPPKISPISLEQLKTGGIHGILAVAEQALSDQVQKTLLSLGQQRLQYPGLSITETACKYVGLHLKANNTKLPDHVTKMYQQRLEKFVADCKISGYLQDNANVLARGSGIAAVRARASGESEAADESADVEKYMAQLKRYEELTMLDPEQLYESFIAV